MKLIWKVQAASTGRYRSFQKRGWPSAYHADGRYAGCISCADDYVPSRIATGDHAPLKVVVADHSKPSNVRDNFGWEVRRLTGEFKTLDEAKAALAKILDKYPHFAGTGGAA